MFNFECWMMNIGAKRREEGERAHAKCAEDAEGQIDWLAQAAGVSWLTLNLEASVIRFLGVAENGGAMHPTIFRRPGLRRHG